MNETVMKILINKGIHNVSSHWLSQAIEYSKSKTCYEIAADENELANQIYNMFLFSDYHEIYNDSNMNIMNKFLTIDNNNKVCVSTPTIFQIDEVLNVGSSHDQKKSGSCPRLLKLFLSIGNLKVDFVFRHYILPLSFVIRLKLSRLILNLFWRFVDIYVLFYTYNYMYIF